MMSAMASVSDRIFYPRRQAIRGLLRFGIRIILPALADIEIVGRENFPASGPLVIVGNHFSFLDPVAVIHATSYPLEFLGGLRTPNAPPITNIFRQGWGVFHVRRGKGTSSRDAILNAQSVLEQRGVLAVFPEGGSWAAVLRPPRPGAALLAARSNAQILPIGLDGFVDVFKNFRLGKRAKATIRIGKPFGPFQLGKGAGSYRQQLDEFGHLMMSHVAELIPPHLRGFYSDDPAIREAAKGTEIYPWDDEPEA
jgi:1-acyl-sn-glycerol-3-phosphate acyltransferase